VGHLVAQYRIYPSEEQAQKLRRWEGALRTLWNLAHEQRLAGLARLGTAKRYLRYQDQAADLTDLRAEVPWIDDVPCNACQQVLRHLDTAWQDGFAKTKGKPRFKRRGRDAMGIAEPDAKRSWRITTEQERHFLRFTRMGSIPLVMHRPLPEGKRGTATITRDVDAWYVSIVVEVADTLTPEARAEQAAKPAVGIDCGVANLLADTNGTLVQHPSFLEAGATKIAKLSRQLARKEKGSRNKEKAKVKLARAHRKVRRQRENLLRTHAHRYAKNHGVVVLEDLRVKQLTRSAAGTAEEPGTRVAQKRGLNRSILAMGWGLFLQYLTQKCRQYGTRLVLVNAAYSSQECAACGHVDAASRVSQASFRCVACGHEDHADVNAAKVILSRRTDGVEVCGGDGEVRPTKQKPKPARSRTPSPRARAKSPVLQGGDGLPR
jgi:putative transposase